jgi:hypothetical protein
MSCADKNIGELIGSYELGLLSDEEKRQFENHLLECEYCFQNLLDAAPITDLIRENKLAPSQNIKFRDDKEKSSVRFFRKKWAFAAASVLALMIIAYVFVRIQKPEDKTERLRGHDDVSILALSPVGEVSAASELRWKPVAGVESYNVKILTENGELVWEGSAKDIKIILPESVNNILIRGSPYYWQVEAQTAKGDRLKSQMVQFKIRN